MRAPKPPEPHFTVEKREWVGGLSISSPVKRLLWVFLIFSTCLAHTPTASGNNSSHRLSPKDFDFDFDVV